MPASAIDFRTEIRILLRDIAAKAQGGLTLREAGQIFIGFLQLAIQAAAQLTLPGSLKKEAVIGAVAELLDMVLPMVPLPWFVSPFRRLIIRKLRVILLAIADGAIEAIYARFKREQPDPQPGS